MIWLISGLLVLFSAMLLMAPLFRASDMMKVLDQDIAALKADLKRLDTVDDTTEEDRLDLERRLLAALDRRDAAGQPASQALPLRPLALALPALIGLSTLGLYLGLGSPNYSRTAITEAEQLAQHSNGLSREDVAQAAANLRLKLDTEDGPVEEYLLLARALMSLDQYDDALLAYGEAIEKDGGLTPSLEGERQSAEAFINRMRMAENMDADQQMAMIQNMVSNLEARLEDNPDDLEGWLRLIQSKMVLERPEEAQAHLDSALAHFGDDDEAVAVLENARERFLANAP